MSDRRQSPVMESLATLHVHPARFWPDGHSWSNPLRLRGIDRRKPGRVAQVAAEVCQCCPTRCQWMAWNLSTPLLDKARATSTWCTPRILTADASARMSAGWDCDVQAMQTGIIGGKGDRLAKASTVRPLGSSPTIVVTTVTPVGIASSFGPGHAFKFGATRLGF